MKKQRSGFRIFASAFAVSLTLLLVTMGTVMSVTVRREESSLPSSSDLSAEDYIPSEKDALCILVITETDGTAFSLVDIDPMTAGIRLISLPGELTAGERTLLEAWEYAGGREAFAAAKEAGLSPDRWLHIRRRGAVNMIDALGGMEWEFSEPLRTDRLDIPVGRHLLDGETVMTLMEEEDDRLPEVTGMALSLIGQRLTEKLVNSGDRLFQVLTANSDGDLSQFDYQSRKKMLRWYLTRAHRVLSRHEVKGTETENGLLLTEEESRLFG
ncbi:MAG: LCP family protein [Oscillospiraceae bacterium]|nr:LCP family protein [Oscillospiraceae bacterium]